MRYARAPAPCLVCCWSARARPACARCVRNVRTPELCSSARALGMLLVRWRLRTHRARAALNRRPNTAYTRVKCRVERIPLDAGWLPCGRVG
eukprot:9400869-Alexandrium_andersonii.AAC.1